MNKEQERVVLVGGGIGGMTAALALAQKNIPSLVLEQAPYFRETGAGILLCPNVYKVFSYLGIDKSLKDIAFFPENLIYADGLTGFEFLKIPMGQHIVEQFQHPYGSVHREELLKTLVDHCRTSSLIELVTSAQVVEVKDNSTGITVITANKEQYSGAALVGCDGLWSSVRQFIVDNERPIASGHVTHRGVIPWDKMPPHLRTRNVTHWDRPGGHMVHYQIGTKGLFNIVAVYHTEDIQRGESPQGDPQELKAHFADSFQSIMELLPYVDTSRKWMLYDRQPTKIWSKGRMTLLGDSAHPTLPHLTQGAGMAIEDAVVLAKKIAESHGDYVKAFEEYQRARYLRTAHVQLFSRVYGEIHHIDGIARELKNHLISRRTDEENYAWLREIYSGIELK